MSYTRPTTSTFKSQFVRDFPYGSTVDYVMDADITNAIKMAGFHVNESLFDSQSDFEFAYNYLAAHFLVQSIKASSQGVAGGPQLLENSKSVGSVSHSLAIPQDILNNPLLSHLTTTYYGQFYVNLCLPKTRGRMEAVSGATLE